MTAPGPDPRFSGWRGACAVIPIKARAQSKSRLAPALAPPARLQLVRTMLGTVLAAARAAHTIRQVMVVSPERDSVPAEIPVFTDTGDSLNGALLAAHAQLLDCACRELVVLPADLPDITAADIDALVTAGRRGGFAIAPDTAGSGTNALYLGAAEAFDFQFGAGSHHLHLLEAQRRGLTPQVVHLPGLAFDVDSPDDLHRLREQPWRIQA